MLIDFGQRIFRKLFFLGVRLYGKDPLTFLDIDSRKLKFKTYGTKYGGWAIPNSLVDSDSVCYLAGCGEDISFDLELIRNFNCHVYAFDPTPRSITYVKDRTVGVKNYHFSPYGIWSSTDRLKFFVPKNPNFVSHSITNLNKTENYLELEVKSLMDLMSLNNHSSIDLLKIDIEGAEYEVIDSMLKNHISVGIFCVEFDEYSKPLDEHSTKRIRNYLKKLLDAGFFLAHVQGYGNYTLIHESYLHIR